MEADNSELVPASEKPTTTQAPEWSSGNEVVITPIERPPALGSETVILAAPMSLAGSAQRIWKLTRPLEGPAEVAGKITAVLVIGVAWFFVLCWYVVFGLLLVPYRLIRRGQRKRRMEGMRHREQLDAIQRR